MTRLTVPLRFVALATAAYAIRDDVDEHRLETRAIGHAPEAFMELQQRAGKSSGARSGKGRHHAAPQVHHAAHRRHHAARKYSEEDEPEEGSDEDTRVEDNSADGQGDDVEADEGATREDTQEVRSEDGQEAEPQDRQPRRSKTADAQDRHPRHPRYVQAPSEAAPESAQAESAESSPLQASNVSAPDRSNANLAGQVTRGENHENGNEQRSWFVTLSCWGILTFIAASIALWMKRPELAEKGMCFVTNRLSAMTLETDVQRKDIAVQAGEPHYEQKDPETEAKLDE